MTKLVCDAVLVPTDDDWRIENPWRAITNEVIVPHSAWAHDELVRWAPDTNSGTAVAFGRIAIDGRVKDSERVERAAAVAGEFVRAAKHRLGDPGGSRVRVALPFIGTAHGGLRDNPGELVGELLVGLRDAAFESGTDVVLTIVDDLAWTAAQQVRRDGRSAELWWDLDQRMVGLAEKLSEHALAGNLVLFIGAGASKDAGAPGWRELLRTIAERLDVPDEEIHLLQSLDLRDQARLLEKLAHSGGGEQKFSALLSEQISKDRFGLTHALLASLMVDSAVTTNYDDLYELACRLPGAEETTPTVLPYEPVRRGRPWLLKLHGDVNKSDMVITRADYLRLNRHGRVLFGIVQALLVTRHLLFVGYSLSDDDFHALVDEIESAIGPGPGSGERGSLGTALVVEEEVWGRLWEGVIDIEPVGGHETGDGKADLSENARTLQIVLDMVAALSVNRSGHLLDPGYSGLLDESEQRIVDEILKLGAEIEKLPETSATRSALLGKLKELGYRG